jgi:beta-glucosidase
MPGFPPGFLWGCATAAYQIEGAVTEGGRGPSIWDRFTSVPGNVRNGESGAIADDHYHRYREDVALMRDIGLSAYRFSVAWPRVMPEGRGTVNEAGMAFYDSLVDSLLESGIEPFVTLYHWDLPQALQDTGGWLNRDTAGWFADYAEAVARRLGDRVTYWITHNEPQVAAYGGHVSGDGAPGERGGEAAGLAATHHLLLSHGRAVEAIRGAKREGRVGITLSLSPIQPATDSEKDKSVAARQDIRQNRLFLDPIFRAAYPEETVAACGGAHVPVRDGDLEVISAPIDFLGVNYYFRSIVRDDGEGRAVQVKPSGSEYTAMGWEVYPDGLRQLLVRVNNDYRPRVLYVTENGAAFPDVRVHDGSVSDPERQRYIAEHIRAVGQAVEAGVPVAGYFAWSLLDNFEWGHGYSKRFGIVYVDYPTLERVPKQSAEWYRGFIRLQRARGTG